MKGFKDILEVSPLGDGKNWILRDGFSYAYDNKETGEKYQIEVPPMFMTDYASIPGILWWFGKPWGKHGMAAVIHDWLYWEKEVDGKKINRLSSDRVFHQCMVESDVKSWRAKFMYLAVKWFASGAWKNNSKLKNQGWKRVAAKYPTSAFDVPKDLQPAK